VHIAVFACGQSKNSTEAISNETATTHFTQQLPQSAFDLKARKSSQWRDCDGSNLRLSNMPLATPRGPSRSKSARIRAWTVLAVDKISSAERSTDLREWCKSHLERYQCTHIIDFVDRLPRTTTGKVENFKRRSFRTSADECEHKRSPFGAPIEPVCLPDKVDF
jgi:hypothetical protein